MVLTSAMKGIVSKTFCLCWIFLSALEVTQSIALSAPYIHPIAGPDSGETTVNILGLCQLPTKVQITTCHFSSQSQGKNVTIVAKHIKAIPDGKGPPIITCSTPANMPGHVDLNIYFDDDLQFSAAFEYYSTESVTLLKPSTGLFQGGIMVSLRGTNFLNMTTLSCRFDDVIVPARYISTSELSCINPPRESFNSDDNSKLEFVPVSVSNNGVDFTPLGSGFQYVRGVDVIEMYPSSGSVGGRSAIHFVVGSDVSQETQKSQYLCIFDGMSSPVLSMSGSIVICNALGYSNAPKVGLILVDLIHVTSQNEKVSVEGRFSYYIYEEPVLAAVEPRVVSELGGTEVYVLGNGFTFGTGKSPRMNISCMFSIDHTAGCTAHRAKNEQAIIVPGRALSDSLVVCIAPPNCPSVVNLRLSLNGYDYTEQFLSVEYSSQVTVTAVHPYVLSSKGGSIIVLGTSFNVDVETRCVIDGTYVTATVLNSTAISCDAPPHTPGNITIDIASHGTPTGFGVLLSYVPLPVVTAVTPHLGHTSGGTIVTVKGSAMINNGLMSCQFNNSVVIAQYISQSEIQCTSPPHFAGEVHLSVSVNGLDYVSSGYIFQYSAHPVILSIHPSSGPDSGGSNVLIKVRNLSLFRGSHTLLRCEFGSEDFTVPAKIVTKQLHPQGDEEIQLLCIAPNHPFGATILRISSNGQQYSPSLIVYEYSPLESVLSVDRSTVLTQGGTIIHVVGNEFKNCTSLSCRFGTTVVSAKYHNQSMVSCVVPRRDESCVVALSVGNNGIDFSQISVSLRYVSPIVPYRIVPTMGPNSGGTRVHVYVTAKYDESVFIQCVFGDEVLVLLFPSAKECCNVSHHHVSCSLSYQTQTPTQIQSQTQIWNVRCQ